PGSAKLYECYWHDLKLLSELQVQEREAVRDISDALSRNLEIQREVTNLVSPATFNFIYSQPTMSLADYLAKNYLTADPPTEKKSKKRKRKSAKVDGGGLIIADDDISGWNTNVAEAEDDDAPMIGAHSLIINFYSQLAWLNIL